MRFFKEENIKIDVQGKEYQMDVMEIPFTDHISVDVKGVDKFILLNHGGQLLTMNGEKMTEELFTGIQKFITQHIK